MNPLLHGIDSAHIVHSVLKKIIGFLRRSLISSLVVDLMSGDEAYIEHIDSAEIKKLINQIYAAKPEGELCHDMGMVHHEDIVQEIDNLLLKLKGSI